MGQFETRHGKEISDMRPCPPLSESIRCSGQTTKIEVKHEKAPGQRNEQVIIETNGGLKFEGFIRQYPHSNMVFNTHVVLSCVVLALAVLTQAAPTSTAPPDCNLGSILDMLVHQKC